MKMNQYLPKIHMICMYKRIKYMYNLLKKHNDEITRLNKNEAGYNFKILRLITQNALAITIHTK